MGDSMTTKAPWWFWLIGGLYLVWNLIGCGMYLAEHLISDADYGEAYGAARLAVRELIPAWATAGYAIGVWGGLAGIILFLLRKKMCLPFLYASFIGAVIGFLPSIFDGRVSAVIGPFDYGLMGFIWIECIIIIWFARKMRAGGILT